MDILLVNAIFGKKRLSEPIGLCYLAAVLRANGYGNVTILEPRILDMSVDDVVQKVVSANPAVLGISTFSFQKGHVFDLVRRSRQRGFKGVIVLGGLGATLCHEIYLKECPEIDAIVCGEGELTFLDMVRALASGRHDWKTIKGVAWRDEAGRVHYNRGRERVRNLDELPFMARDILEENISLLGKDRVTACVLGGRGCYNNCSFCWISNALDMQEGLRYRQRSVRNVVDEIQTIVETYGVTDFSFEDDNFILPGAAGIERAREFRDEVKKRGLKITFFFQTRPDTVSREAISLFKEAGLAKLFIGIEAITEEDLALYRKCCTPRQLEECLAILREFDYLPDVEREHRGRVRFGYIAFHPLTTVRSLRQSLEFFQKHRLTPKRLLTKVNLYDGDMDIARVFAEKGAAVEGGTYQFKDPMVGKIYECFSEYCGNVFEYREAIRSIEKHLVRLGTSKSDYEDLCADRRRLDDMALGFLGGLLSIAEEPGGAEEKRARLERFLAEELERLKCYARETNLSERIQACAAKYGATSGMHDMYW